MVLIYQSARGHSAVFVTAESAEDSLLIGAQDTLFMLEAVEGLYDTRAEIYAIDTAEQAGALWISSRVKRRVITLEGFILNDVPASRRRLTACLSPLEPGWLTLRRTESSGVFERRIRCVVEQGPIFDKTDGSRFTAGLVAPSPWWEDSGSDSMANLTGWVGAVIFPWSMTEGFQFGGRTPDTAVNVVNPGDVSAGVTIRMYAAGPVLRPCVNRPGTSDAMLVTTELAQGESFEINTGVGEKYARYTHADGSIENGMRYINPNSTFFQLETCDNLFKAEAESGAEALTVTMSFRPQYLSV
ncbi:hypothetical protein FACS1894184_00650 [Clostridia bacterium]|nr:hypothetical protein FACS1894184_00650 [Clostridia bacterium]